MEELLNILGNETRREILHLLSERPCYVSQLSQELQIGQKAIIEHLQIMTNQGILESRSQKIEKGRPRKYYEITSGVILEVAIGQDTFTMQTLSPKIDPDILNAMPKIKDISKDLEKTNALQGEVKIEALDRVLKDLDEEEKRVTLVRKAIRYLKAQAVNDLKKEILEEELRTLF